MRKILLFPLCKMRGLSHMWFLRSPKIKTSLAMPCSRQTYYTISLAPNYAHVFSLTILYLCFLTYKPDILSVWNVLSRNWAQVYHHKMFFVLSHSLLQLLFFHHIKTCSLLKLYLAASKFNRLFISLNY